jgi:hypothetical protein
MTVARLCPDTVIGRSLLKIFVEGPARWLERPRLSQAIPYAIAAIALGLLLFAAPELSVVAAGLDIQLLVDLTLAMSVAIAQIGLRRIRVLTHKTMHAITVPLRPRGRSRHTRRTRSPRADSDDCDPALVLA